MTDPLLFVLAILTLLGTPGPTNTLLATAGAMNGLRASLPLIAAELTGYLVASGLVRLLLGPVLVTWPLLGAGLKGVVAAYLVLLGWRLWRKADGHGKSATVTFRSVLVTTLLNPKAPVIALAVIPQGATGEPAYWLVFASLVPVMGMFWISVGRALGMAAGSGRTTLLRRVAGAMLMLFAGLVALSAFR